MGLFSNIIPTFLNNTGEWIDRTFNSPVKPTATPPASGSTPQFAQGEDIITKGINLIKSQFVKSLEAQQKLAEAPRQIAIQMGMPKEEAVPTPITRSFSSSSNFWRITARTFEDPTSRPIMVVPLLMKYTKIIQENSNHCKNKSFI